MGDSLGSKVFEASREVTNWTIPGHLGDDTGKDDDLDYSTENYWTVYPSSSSPPLNSTYNGTISLESGNQTGSMGIRDEDLAKVEMAVLALIFIFTVLGNCVVLLGIFFRRQKMTRMYYFILHLSVADLITAFFNVLTQLFWEITYRFQGGNFLCKFVKYTQILGPYSSSYVLVMTAMDRYQAICYPLSNCTWTARRSKFMLGVAWAVSLLCCVPQIFIFSYQQVPSAPGSTSPPEFDCWATFPEWGGKAYVTWYSITVFIIPLIILVFAYSCITRAIWINFNMKAAAGRNHDNYERKMTRQDSDEMEVPSHYEHSQDGGEFQRDGRLSIGSSSTNASQQNKPTKKSNINLYNPSKHFLKSASSTNTATTNASPESSTRKGDSTSSINKKSVNNIITATKTSCTCNTQSSTLSPALSGHHIHSTSAGEDKNSLCLASQKFTNGVAVSALKEHQADDEEQLQLIPKDGIAAPKSCHSCDKNDLDGNEHRLKNGSVKLSGVSPMDTCQHGSYATKHCNHCHLSSSYGDGDIEGQIKGTSMAVLNKEMRAEVVGQQGGKISSPSPVISGIKNRDKDQNSSVTRNPSYRFSGKSSSRHLLLPMKNRFSVRRASRRGSGGAGNHEGKQSTKSVATYVDNQQPRTHSVKGISRAKIKTIKLTVTIICCYIFCSSPFIAAQLWSVYDPNAANSAFFNGPTFTILTLLASLNSCVNPYIFLFFNPNLLQNCFQGIFRRQNYHARRRFNNGSPLSRTLSQSKKVQLGVGVGVVARNPTHLHGTYTRTNSTGTTASIDIQKRTPGSRLSYHQAMGGSSIGEGSPRLNCPTDATTRLSPLIMGEAAAGVGGKDAVAVATEDTKSSTRSLQHHPQRIPSSNGFEKGYLKELSERSENNAVEMVDSTLPLLSSSSSILQTNCSTSKQDIYSSTTTIQPCRVETALVGVGTKNHNSTSTLIT